MPNFLVRLGVLFGTGSEMEALYRYLISSEVNMKAKRSLLMVIVLVSLAACSHKVEVITPAPVASVTPTFTPWVAGTETALANPLPALATQTAQALVNQNVLPTFPPPTFTPAVMEKPTDFSPVLYGGKLYDAEFFLLLGGVSREGWYAPDMSVARFSGEATYSLHNMEYVDKYFLWGGSPEFSPTCKTYSIRTDAGLDEAGFVATLDGWDVTKREVTELSADGEFYRQAVLDWLAAEGVESLQIGTLQILRVDIEGDGSDEIIISATRLDGSQHTTKAGDYSVVLMRKVAGNDAVTIQLVADIYSSKELEITYPRTYSLANFIDLNQDGVLEVVVDIQQWEGFGAIVYQIEGQDVHEALRAEC